MKNTLIKLSQSLKYIMIICLTLGLAPFSPEPHIVGKILWVAGGAVGMQAIDWFDFFLHGFPWILLILALIGKFLELSEKRRKKD